MFYRRKIILALLEEFGNELSKTDFEKYLFLFSQEQIKNNLKPCYYFIPYKYGCFSIHSYFDIGFLKKNNILSNKDHLKKIDNTIYSSQIKKEDINIIKNIYKMHNKKDTKALINFIYKNYPYYSINSQIVNKYLSKEEIYNSKSFLLNKNKNVLFTIGYEGISFEEYLNKLIQNNIKLVIDVRKNAISMKYGFSKSILKKWLNNLNIEYEHIPQLGIDSEKRKKLNNQTDYNKLFNHYKETTLLDNFSYIKYIYKKIIENKRAALTCFEALPCQCHRSIVRDAIISLDEWNILEYGVIDI